MPKPHDARDKALFDLEAKLGAMEAKREAEVRSPGLALSEGHKLAANLIGGVLGGVGFGWLFDHFAGTTPLGLLVGLLGGTGLSIFAAVRTAVRATKQAVEDAGPLPIVIDDEDED